MWFQNHLNDRYQAVKIKNIILKYYPLHRILFSVKNDDNQDILFLFFVFCETGIEFLYQSYTSLGSIIYFLQRRAFCCISIWISSVGYSEQSSFRKAPDFSRPSLATRSEKNLVRGVKRFCKSNWFLSGTFHFWCFQSLFCE